MAIRIRWPDGSVAWRILAAFLAALVVSASPAQAAGFPDGEFGGWTVVQLDEACAMTMEYEGTGSTRLSLFERHDGMRFIIVDNDLWSAKEGEAFEIKASLGGWVYTIPAEGSSGKRGRRGIMFTARDDFFRDFAASAGLTLHRGDTLIDDLSLSGSAAGVAAMKRCLVVLKRDRAAAERERSRLAHIPGDPFAPAPSEDAATNLDPLFPTRDAFPSAAIREGASGKVYYRAVIGADAALKSCSLVKPSAVASLDNATCAFIAMRKPWAGQLNGSGSDTIITGVVDWQP